MNPSTLAHNATEHTAALAAGPRIDRNDYLAPAQSQLEREFVDAFFESPEATVSTPAHNTARNTVAFLVNDNFSSTDGEKSLHHLLRIVADASKGRDVKGAAMLWIAEQACEFSRTHVDDLAREMADEAEEARRAWR